MQPYFAEIYNRLAKSRTQITEALEGLQDDASDWSPGPEMNSITAIVTHIVGSERYWVGEVILGEPSHRDREAEFAAKGQSMAQLQELLADSLSYLQQALETLDHDDLVAPRATPKDGRETTVGWVLALVLHHAGEHLGHIQMTRQLWEQRQRG